MKLNKSKIKKILSIIIVVLAIAMFLHDQFTVPEAADPAAPESSQAVTLPEEDAPAEEEAPQTQQPTEEEQPEEEPDEPAFALDVLDEKGSYTSMEDVADYIHIFGRLPQNFITKEEAVTSAGKAVRATCGMWPPAKASAATALATMKVCCPKPKAAPGPNVTSATRAATATTVEWFSPMTGSSITPTTTMKALPSFIKGAVR